MMFARWPSASAAPSTSRLLATSMLLTTSAKVDSDSVATPSSPPMASICRICSALVTCVREKSMADFRRCSNCSSVPCTVLRMSR